MSHAFGDDLSLATLWTFSEAPLSRNEDSLVMCGAVLAHVAIVGATRCVT